MRLIAGTLFGLRSPVRTFSEMFYADALLPRGSRLTLSAEHEERAIYVVKGAVQRGGNQTGGECAHYVRHAVGRTIERCNVAPVGGFVVARRGTGARSDAVGERRI